MKNTKKLLVGVLSVAALLGTGVAAWTIGGGLTSNTAEAEPEIVTTVNNRDIKLVVEAKDDKIKFDSEDDLEVTYNVKAQRGDKTDVNFDPYDLTNYANIADEYKPDLTVTTKAVDKESGEELKADNPFFDYIVLPKAKTIYYDTWLASVNKDLGQDITLEFAWGEEVGGLNPQVYADKNNLGLSKTDQEKWFNTLTDTLSGVKFQFVFEVKGVKEDVPPVEEETGEVTLPTVDGSAFSIEGSDPEKGPVTAGKHVITITTDEGKVVKDNKLTIMEGETPVGVTLNENPLTRAVGHTYTWEHEFKADVDYRFEYTVVDETPDPATKYAVTFTATEGGSIDVKVDGESITSGDEVDEGKEVVVTVAASEGYKLTELTVNGDPQGLENTTLTLKVDKALDIKATFEKEDTPVVEYTKLADVVKLENGTEFTTRGYWMGNNGIDYTYEGETYYNASYIADGDVGYQLYKVDNTIIDNLELIPGETIVEVKGKVSNYTPTDDKTGEVTGLTVLEAEVNSITVVESDEQISKPVIDVINTENAKYEFDESKINRKVKIEGAVVDEISVGNHDNTTIDFSVGVEKYSLYLDSRYTDLSLIDGLVIGSTFNFESWVGTHGYDYQFVYINNIDFDLVQPESVTLTAEKTEIFTNEQLKLTYATKPEVVSVVPTFSSSDDKVATVNEKGIVTGIAQGTATITVSFENGVKHSIEITVSSEVEPVADSVVYEYDIIDETIAGNVYGTGIKDAADALAQLKNTKTPVSDDIISEVTNIEKIYKTDETGKGGIKFGGSSGTANLTFNTSKMISKIEITYIGWNNDNTDIIVNGVKEDTLNEENYNNGVDSETHVFNFAEPTNVISIDKLNGKKRFVLVSMKLYIAQ